MYMQPNPPLPLPAVRSPGPRIKPMAWQAESPAMAPVLSFSVVAPETYARATATLPKTGTAHLHKYQPHLLQRYTLQ